MRDLALNLFWANRFAMTMYEKRPTRWADVPRTPRRRLPAGPRPRGRTATARSRPCRRLYDALPATWDGAVEDRIFGDRSSTCSGTASTTRPSCRPIKPTVAEILADPSNLTFRLPDYDPDFPVYDFDDIVDCCRGRARARGPAPVGHGAAQPVPLGPRPRPSWSRSASCATTTTSSSSTPATRRSASSCAAWSAADPARADARTGAGGQRSRSGRTRRSTCAGTSPCMPRHRGAGRRAR